MLAQLRSRLTYANVMATVAVFLALGGGAYAAATIGSAEIKNNAVRSKDLKNNDIRSRDIRTGNVGGSDIKNNGVRGTDILESSLGKVPTAGNADSATNAINANTAGDAGKLGGISPDGWVRRECNQNSGQIKGFAGVDGSGTFSSTFTEVTGYNCSNQSVEARRIGPGRYEVRFNGAPVTRAVATAMVTSLTAVMVSIRNLAPGLFEVEIINPLPAPGAFEDHPFAMIAP